MHRRVREWEERPPVIVCKRLVQTIRTICPIHAHVLFFSEHKQSFRWRRTNLLSMDTHPRSGAPYGLCPRIRKRRAGFLVFFFVPAIHQGAMGSMVLGAWAIFATWAMNEL